MDLHSIVDRGLYILSISIAIYSTILSFTPDPYYTHGWVVVTTLGSSTFYIAIGLLIYFIDEPTKAYKAILALMISGWLNLVIKNIVAMPRPRNPRIEVGGYAFPSGHAQSSTTFWSSIAALYKRSSIVLFSAVMIGAVSYSRIALNVHYPLDILGGVAIGLAVTSLFTMVLMERLDTYSFKHQILFHITAPILLYLTYLIHPNGIFLQFAGFILGLSLHPILHREISVGESLFKRILKFLIAFFIVVILSRIGLGPLETLVLSSLMGLSIPIIRFKI